MIKVLVNGALGRMGQEVVKSVYEDKELELVGAVDVAAKGQQVSEFLNIKSDVIVMDDLKKALDAIKPDVVVDFTRPSVVMDNLRVILKKGIKAVVGTTGFTKEDFTELDTLSKDNNTAVLIAPNFSIGANLMMNLSQEVIKFMPKAEIIELHHDNKLDAPSGTAIITAQRMSEARGKGYIKQGHPEEEEKLEGARGANIDGIPIHSVRLQGYVAHQEVIFGALGETLTIRHDSNSRECFMPGVVMACKKIQEKSGFIYGLDKIMN